MDSKAVRLESSGAHKAAEALGSTCVGVWASRKHAAAAGTGQPCLQAAGALGPVC
jgi:hypothetical protein